MGKSLTMMKPLYTFDIETDPFRYMRIPKPFACGFFDGETFHHRWGKDCMERMREFLTNFPPGIVYVHFGGKFDFYYMLEWFNGKMSIVGNKIIKTYGIGHEWRDSFAIYPEALETFKKDEIDITKFESNVREQNKDEILLYLRGDCVYLHELVTKFWGEFGDNLTIGAASMKEIKKRHKFDTLDAIDDSRIRSKYYYGGRVQCFEKGIITPKGKGKLYCYDINQSYPTSMRNYLHPIGMPKFGFNLSDVETFFLTVEGYSNGCFPVRNNDGGLCFPVGQGMFHVSIHEYNAAIETNQFRLSRIVETVNFDKVGCFDEFVDHFHGLRNQAKRDGNELFSTFYKRICNSGYGKFAQSPDNYKDYLIKPIGITPNGYDEEMVIGNVVLWSKDSEDVSRYNVATGASITGCSRSFLIRALASATRPIYCDTDSIICESLGSDIEYDEYKIGAWKTEKMGDKFALAGRKLYALFDGDKCVKMACKGVRLTPQEIETVARGGKVTWKRDAPTYSLLSGTRFIHRDIQMLPSRNNP
jgi:hypothetical protein